MIKLIFTILITFTSTISAGTVRGRLIDKDSNKPLIGAVIILEKTRLGAVSTNLGEVVIRDIPAGIYNFRIQCYCYITKDINSVEVLENSDFKLSTVEMQVIKGFMSNKIPSRECGENTLNINYIKGILLNKKTKEPVSGALIYLNDNENESCVSDFEGEFYIANITVSENKIRIEHNNFVSFDTSVTINISNKSVTEIPILELEVNK